MKTIDAFKGKYYFLSNFYPDGKDTNEHLFQSEKAQWPDDRAYVRRALTPMSAKKRGRQVALRPDWENIKDEVMKRLLVMKFESVELSRLLLATGTADLIEGNHWGDTYWGVDDKTGKGFNMLGRLLMEVRDELRVGAS